MSRKVFPAALLVSIGFRSLEHNAALLEHLKQYQQALADCNAVIKLNAKAYWAYHLRALVYHELGQHQLAESDLKMEKKLNGH